MKKYILLLLIASLFISFQLAAQHCRVATNPESIKLTKRAKRYYNQYPAKALKNLLEAVKIERANSEAHYLIAKLYDREYDKLARTGATKQLLARKQIEVVSSYKAAIKNCRQQDDYRAYYHLGMHYYKAKNRATAITHLQEFIGHGKGAELIDAKYHIKACRIYLQLKNNPVPFRPKAIKAACTTDDEYLPLVSPDGRYLFFTRRARKKIQAGKLFLDEVFMNSEQTATSGFGTGKLMKAPFNNGKNQGGATITIDNKTMFVTICTSVFFGETPYKNCDLYQTNSVNGKWTAPKNLGTNVNGRHTFEAQPTISADGKTLYFVSIRDGGFGKMDIYKTTRNKYGGWSLAENLGPQINTVQDDKTPFIHTDGKTLYFASKGHFGMGGFDIFYTKTAASKWSKPINIGYPINTEADDLGLMLTANGENMYFASRVLSADKQYDLFTAKLYKAARPEPVLFLKGNITNTSNEQLAGADVTLENLKTKKITKGRVDKYTGEYAVAVPVKKKEDYVMTVDKNGHIFRSAYIDPSKEKFDSITVIDFKIPPIKKGTKVQLENIYFEFNSSEFNYKSRVSLANFYKFLARYPKVNVGIYGHTDSAGDDAYNLKLSDDRAKAVFDYLLGKGIDFSRLKYKGFGESAPVAPNSTDIGRAKNRRTEFIIL